MSLYPSSYSDTGFEEIVLPMRLAFDNWVSQFPGEEQNRIAASERLIVAKSLDEVKQALDDGAFVDSYIGYRKFPTRLSLAACHGNLEEISLLVERGAWIDDPVGDKYGFGRPLETAYYQDQPEAAIRLLRLGANPNAGDPLVLGVILESHAELGTSNWELVDAIVGAGGRITEWQVDRIREVAGNTHSFIHHMPEVDQQSFAATLTLVDRLVLQQGTAQAAGAWCPSPQQAEDFADRMTGQAQGTTQEAPQQQRARMRL